MGEPPVNDFSVNLTELEAETALAPLPTLEEMQPGFQKRKMLEDVKLYESWWEHQRAPIAHRNLAYWRGEFWDGDGLNAVYLDETQKAKYRAERNEVFPILDTQRSALAKDLPQIEMKPMKIGPELVGQEQDLTWVGRGLASALNAWARKDELDEVVQELVLNALVFDEGGIVKTQWSPELRRVSWQVKQPWEVMFSNDARAVRTSPWCFERFALHWDDYAARVNDGAYDRPSSPVRPDVMPRTPIDRLRMSDTERTRTEAIAEYVSIVEWWDFRTGKLFHLLPDHNHVLMETTIPYGRPYQVLSFNPGLGRIRGISDVSLIANIQRDINELASSRREMVQRLVRRMLIDRALFASEDEWQNFVRSRSWEPTRVTVASGRRIEEFLSVTPEVSTTMDFNAQFEGNQEHIRHVSGLGDYQRGQRQHFRTAEEAGMVAGATEGRLATKQTKVMKVVSEMFACGLEAWKWAAASPEVSHFDAALLVQDLGLNVDPIEYTRQILSARNDFNLLPFSPLMEDRNTRKRTLLEIIERLSKTPALDFIDWKGLAREVFELFDLTPSLVMEQPAAPPPGAPPMDPSMTPAAGAPIPAVI